jgi:23S rRNA (guanosine2251-2'-O)-methyltransferase
MAKNISSQIVFGRNPVMELLDSGKEIERIYLKHDTRGELEVNLRSICKERDIPLKKVPEIKLDKLAPNRAHQGIIAISSLIHYQSIDDVISLAYSNGQDPLLIIIDGLQDVRNIGAIARSCEVLGAHGLVMSGKQAAVINEDAIKTSAGAILRLPICREISTIALIQALQGLGIRVIGSSLKTNTLLSAIDFKVPIAIIFGSEGDGLSREASEACDQLIKIPQVGALDSLNVSVATGIVLYECLRQKTL